MVSYPCGPPSSLDTGMSMVSLGSRLVCPLCGRGRKERRGCTPMPMKPLPPCRSPPCQNRGPGYSPTCQGLVANQLLGPIHGRGVWLFGKWRDVVDQLRAFFVHGPDVPALGTAVVVSARQLARGRQKPARRTGTRWTDRGHGLGDHPSSIGDGSSRYQGIPVPRSVSLQ